MVRDRKGMLATGCWSGRGMDKGEERETYLDMIAQGPVDLHCQLGRVWNHPEDTHLAVPRRHTSGCSQETHIWLFPGEHPKRIN